MLPAAHRLRRSNDFSTAMRAGRRSGRGSVVVHLAVQAAQPEAQPQVGPEEAQLPEAQLKASSELLRHSDGAFSTSVPGASDVTTATAGVTVPTKAPVTRAGFVVSKAVGNAVVRNKVKRRLRQLVAERLSTLPPGSTLVVRALPQAAVTSYDQLGLDLDSALAAVLAPRRRSREDQRTERR
jgi:ribonuclease P protein component